MHFKPKLKSVGLAGVTQVGTKCGEDFRSVHSSHTEFTSLVLVSVFSLLRITHWSVCSVVVFIEAMESAFLHEGQTHMRFQVLAWLYGCCNKLCV